MRMWKSISHWQATFFCSDRWPINLFCQNKNFDGSHCLVTSVCAERWRSRYPGRSETVNWSQSIISSAYKSKRWDLMVKGGWWEMRWKRVRGLWAVLGAGSELVRWQLLLDFPAHLMVRSASSYKAVVLEMEGVSTAGSRPAVRRRPGRGRRRRRWPWWVLFQFSFGWRTTIR